MLKNQSRILHKITCHAVASNPHYAVIGRVLTTVINKCFSHGISKQEGEKIQFATNYIIAKIQFQKVSGKKIRTNVFLLE